MILVHLIIGYLALYLVIWSHEVAHAVMYYRYGCKKNPLEVHVPIYLMFSSPAPINEEKSQNLDAKQSYHIGIAGVLFNLAFGIPLFIFLYFNNSSSDDLIYYFTQLFVIFHLLEATTYLVINNIFLSGDITAVQEYNPGLRLPYFLIGLVSLTLTILLILNSPEEWRFGTIFIVIVIACAMGIGRVVAEKLNKK